jgi:hypothetical protein
LYESSHNYTLSVCPEKSMKELHATLVTHMISLQIADISVDLEEHLIEVRN